MKHLALSILLLALASAALAGTNDVMTITFPDGRVSRVKLPAVGNPTTMHMGPNTYLLYHDGSISNVISTAKGPKIVRVTPGRKMAEKMKSRVRVRYAEVAAKVEAGIPVSEADMRFYKAFNRKLVNEGKK